MRSARSTLIDATPITVLGICPLCDHREFGDEEVTVRRGLLAHLTATHEQDESKRARDALYVWLKRKGLAA